jgi:mono/diheme cytochrome c family protein
MTSPPGADEHLGALTNEERAALAAWADDGDVPDGFADRVVAACVSERLAESLADDVDDDVAVGSRPAAREGRVVRLVGLCAAIAAAAAVMLMVRVLPRASEVDVQLAAAGEPSRVEPAPTEPAAEADAIAAEAALVLAQHCSPCHDSTDPGAQPAALQVFDVEQPRWWILMSDAQLEEARLRVQELEAATDDDRRKLDAFAAARRRPPAHAG